MNTCSKETVAFNQMRKFIADNLHEAVKELIEWHETTILRNGKVREAVAMINPILNSDGLRIIESEVQHQALRKLAELVEISENVKYFLDNEPSAIRVREGGGLENIAMSFAVTIAKLNKKK